ncbi:MAG: ferrous iron transport protein B [Kiritimatiellae bacterium]|nr:ferrous iron transport protein B [Kiritimatiellia bacterium]
MGGALNVVLVGNPNTGKTTLFNLLTGARERTGNWTGVTVESAHAGFTLDGRAYRIADLPGIYSFSPDTEDERVARDYLIRNRPSAVINIVDASNLERSLYLTSQLLDMRVPLVVALNQVDVAERHGVKVDAQHLAQHLGCPVVPMVASRGEGLAALRAAVADVASAHRLPAARVVYGEAEPSVRRLQVCLIVAADDAGVDSRWLAIKLLEGDPFARALTSGLFDTIVSEENVRLARHTGQRPETVVMDARLGFIRGLARDVVSRRGEMRRRFSDAADRVLLSRPVGIPAFLGVMFAVFWLTVRLTQPLVDFFDSVCGALLVSQTRVWLTALNAPDLLIALLADGVGAGLTTVATFMPPICMIFLCLTLLEESGYMARAAFIMDRFLNGIGLPGKAFIPLLVGFGCTVPALMATRTLEQRRARVLTMLIAPFMSCGARMPVYAIFAMAFFERSGNLVIFALYLTGGLLAILSGLVLHRTLLKGEAAAFVMELPPYHVPALRGCLEHVWANLKSFLTRAGQVIVVIALLLSLGNAALDRASGDAERAAGWRASAAQAMTLALRPMGVSEQNWPAAAGLLTGLMAKEAIVGTLEVLYAHVDDASDDVPFSFGKTLTDAGRQLAAAYRFGAAAAAGRAEQEEGAMRGGGLLDAMRRHFGSRAAAFAYLLFVLIYSPCVAALIVLAREAGWRWMLFAVSYQTLLAWMVATVFNQLATCAEAPLRAAIWVGSVAAAAAGGYGLLRVVGKRVIV